VLPDDYHTHWFLFQALTQLRRKKEAAVVMSKAERLRDRAERLGELQSRKMSEQPLDPALHTEVGVLLVRDGNDAVGESWLRSALSLDPKYRPAHVALAELYQRKGDTVRAERHRRLAQEGK